MRLSSTFTRTPFEGVWSDPLLTGSGRVPDFGTEMRMFDSEWTGRTSTEHGRDGRGTRIIGKGF
jgi:hypothetical protein